MAQTKFLISTCCIQMPRGQRATNHGIKIERHARNSSKGVLYGLNFLLSQFLLLTFHRLIKNASVQVKSLNLYITRNTTSNQFRHTLILSTPSIVCRHQCNLLFLALPHSIGVSRRTRTSFAIKAACIHC